MMSEPVFFEWLEIGRFRGFAEPRHIALDGSVIILWGPNGTGKTSFFDAIQWLLVGSIERLESWRVRRNVEHIINSYSHASGDSAVVAAGIRIGGRHVELRRSGSYKASQLEWRDEKNVLYEGDAEAELAQHLTPLGRMSLKRSLLSSGMLQQDVIREVLEDKPAQRYEHLASILGLDSLADFPNAAKKRAERLAAEGSKARERHATLESSIRSLEERVTTLRTRAAKSPDLEEHRNLLMRRIEPYELVLKLQGPVPVDPAEAAQLRSSAGLAANLLAEWASEAQSLSQGARSETQPEPDIAGLRKALEEASQSQAAARLMANKADQEYRNEHTLSDRMSRLAKEALPLLGARCPVCTQLIAEDEVHQHLEQLVEEGSASLAQLEKKKEETAEALRAAESKLERAAAALEAAERQAKEMANVREREAKWQEKVIELFDGWSSVVVFPQKAQIVGGDVEAVAAAREACEQLAEAATTLHAALSWSPETGSITAGHEEIAELQSRAREARDAAVAASAAEEEGRALQRAAVRAVAAITKERFDFLRPVIQDIYARLDPHPTFTHLRFSVDVYREKGIASPEVVDAQAEVDADPLLVFSSSQANVVALSTFLALGWMGGEDSMPFLLLDDPLQSLDDVNALGFADLCRHMRTRKQLIVSTHDERLASLLVRKLAPRRESQRSRAFRFIAWNREGPIVEGRDIEPQLDQQNRLMLAKG